jgi:hypothetical protein
MKKPALLVVSALMAGAFSLPTFAAGTNEKNPDSPATGMTGTGSNALDPNAGGASTGSSAVVVPAAPASTVVVPSGTVVSPAPAGTVVSPAPAGTVVAPAAPAGTVVYPADRSTVNRDTGAAVNHGAVGGESAGKSSDSPAQ